MPARRRQAPRLTIHEISRSDDPGLDAAYALLASTFPRSERVPLTEWRSTLREKSLGVWTDLSWHLLVARRGRRTVGIATGTYFGSLNAGMIGYLATDPSIRSAGLGTRLRRHLRRAFERDALRLRGEPLVAILGEVSSGNRWLRALARRPGVLVLDMPYYQPRLYRTDDPSPFFLYYESLSGAHRASLPVGELRRILYAIWRRGYRVSRPLQRPAFRLMMRYLAGRRRIGPARIVGPGDS